MIQHILHRVFRRSSAKNGPERIPVSVHGLRQQHISAGALKVVEGLQAAHFVGYVVGGAVRDLLMGKVPKDFDVVTDATPEEVRRLFRRSRIIGRRFRIVHVMSGGETIEVSTFRADHHDDSETDEHGRILHDNVFGEQKEDAARRDFTVNALYYNPIDETILDYYQGVGDVQKKILRIIGDPRSRYREDPVRMLRAVRLAAKLGLSIDPLARAPIQDMASLLENVPPARLFDEMLKLLLSGHAVACLKQLRDEGLHHGLLPLLDVIMQQPLGERFVWLALADTDRRVLEGLRVSPGFLFASLLWHEVLADWERRKAAGNRAIPASFEAMHDVLERQGNKLAITRRIVGDIKEIWALQPRFELRSGARPLRLLEQARFRAGLDFLILRAESGEVPQELAQWWRDFSVADTLQQKAMLLPETVKPKRRRRKKANRAVTASES